VAGVTSVGCGAVGVVVPGFPTTIFLILATWCFARSCPWLERRLIRENRLFRPFVSYLAPGARMPRRAKALAIALMWAAVSVSVTSILIKADGRTAGLGMAGLTVALAGVGTVFIVRQGGRRSPGASEHDCGPAPAMTGA